MCRLQCRAVCATACTWLECLGHAPETLPATVQRLAGDILPAWERVVCKVLIPVSSVLSVLGIVFTITALVQVEGERR